MLKKETLSTLEWLRDVHLQMLKDLDEKYKGKSMLEIKENGRKALEESVEALNDVLCELRMMPAINRDELKKSLWGKWIISEIQCPSCFEYFDTDCYSTEELKKCPICDAKLIGEEEQNENN